MLFKIFEANQVQGNEHSKFEGMTIFYDVNQDGIQGVSVYAYHSSNGLDYIQDTFFDMTIENAKRFIADYSLESAESYIKEFSIQ